MLIEVDRYHASAARSLGHYQAGTTHSQQEVYRSINHAEGRALEKEVNQEAIVCVSPQLATMRLTS